MTVDLFAPRHGGRPYADYIDAEGDCWNWTGGINAGGYGKARYEGRNDLAHRAIWQALVGPIPEGFTIDHLCRNRRCVNPDHLEPVTYSENLLRSPITVNSKSAARTHCPKGHALAGDNLSKWRDRRECRTCRNDRARARRKASKV